MICGTGRPAERMLAMGVAYAPRGSAVSTCGRNMGLIIHHCAGRFRNGRQIIALPRGRRQPRATQAGVPCCGIRERATIAAMPLLPLPHLARAVSCALLGTVLATASVVAQPRA